MDAVADRCPSLYPWPWACYGSHSWLFCGLDRIASASGVQQGDPLGPLVFSLGIQSTLEELAEKVLWQGWYLDDGVIVGSLAQLGEAMRMLRGDFASRGLEVNAAKCELWGPFLGTGMRPHLPLDRPGALELVGVQLIPFTMESGTVLVGSPVVHPESSGQFSR